MKRFIRSVKKQKNKILCLIVCCVLIMSMFTVFSSANTVEGDNVVYPQEFTYFPYPNFKGFAFNYDNVSYPLGQSQDGVVWNTLNYIYGLDSSTDDLTSPTFNHVWSDGFSFIYYDNLNQKHLEQFPVTSRLQAYNPGGAPWTVGEVLQWVQNLHTGEVDKYITGNTLYVYYEDFVVNREMFAKTTPYIALTRYHDSNYGSSVPCTVTYEFSYYDYNVFTAIIERPASYSEDKTNWLYGEDQYAYINLTPYTFIKRYFDNHPDSDYLYIPKSTCTIRVKDNVDPGYFHNINFYHTLITDDIREKYDLTLKNYMNTFSTKTTEPITDADFASWLTSAIGGFMSFEIFPGFSFQLIFMVLVGSLMFFFFLRLFSGG